MHFVDDSVIAHSNAIHIARTNECGARRRSRILREQLDDGPDSLLISTFDAGERLERAAADLELEAHASPRSCFANSHGTKSSSSRTIFSMARSSASSRDEVSRSYSAGSSNTATRFPRRVTAMG